nr:SCY1-like protein 2 isoform X1 [Dermatophagoides farinae]
MFSKLKSSSSSPNSASPTLSTNSFGGSGSGCNNIDVNPISQYYECGKQIGSAGPELVWKIFDAVRKTDMKDASLFFYDKRTADKLHKPKRKEMIAEILRFSVRQLDRFRHPRILAIMHPVEESSDTLAFATEPILGSLANCYEYLEERLPQSYEPLPLLRESNLLDFEIKYGLLQIVEALIHLHHNCKVIHRNISPQSILINKKGTWKLAGFEFVEKCNDNDIMNVIPCQPYTSKLPKMGQPDLDFTAPEVQTQSLCTPNSDMFSLGLLITFLYNNGRSLITANLNASNYLKQLDSLNVSLNQLLPNIPSGLHESLKSLLEIDYKKRPISQNLTTSKYFVDPSVQALHYLDIIQMKDSVHKSNFYHNLKNLLPSIPTKLWYQHILPSMVCELESPEVLAAALQPIIHMINRSTLEQFQEFILPFIKNIFQMPKSVQATVTLLENIDILMLKTCTSDFFRTEIVPMICNAFDSSTPQIQSAAMSALSQVIDHLDEVTIRRMILPKTKQLFDINADVKIQINILICIEKVIGNLDKSDILDDVLPMIMRARIQDVSVLIIVINICKLMMMDTKKYGITVNILAMKIMPALVPALANVNLNIDEFNDLVSLLNEMLTYVAKTQRNKLVLEKNNNVTVTTIKIPEITESLRESNTTLNNINSLGSYPHRPPSLRLESRRTSISMDDVVRRASLTSAASSPDSNLLRVQAHLPGRRHSDNTILPPRILVAPSTPTTSFSLSRGPSTSNLNARRHSSIVGLKEMKDSKNFIPNIPKISHNISNNLGIESFLSSRSSGRRYSAVPTFDKLNFSSSSSSSHHHKNTSTNLLQTIGTGVQQLFK